MLNLVTRAFQARVREYGVGRLEDKMGVSRAYFTRSKAGMDLVPIVKALEVMGEDPRRFLLEALRVRAAPPSVEAGTAADEIIEAATDAIRRRRGTR